MIERIVRDTDTHTFENSADILEGLNYYRKISKEGINKLSDSDLAKLKSDFNNFFNLNLAFFADTYPTKLFRVTNNKKLYGGKKVKLQKVSDLIGPPSGLSNIGRCNLNGESVFYAALDTNTALWETQPQIRDYITISECVSTPFLGLGINWIKYEI